MMPNPKNFKNFYLLVLIIAYFFCNVLLASHELNPYLVSAGLAFTILICINFIAQSKIISILTLPLAMFAIGSYVLLYITEPSTNLFTFHFTVNGIFLVMVTVVEIRAVVHQPEITLNTILGAICGYLLLGLTWSYFYLAISHAQPSSFTPMPPNESFRINLDYFTYFSYSTLTTLGIGDIVPKSNLARTLTWIEAATGQIYLAVWISQLVGLHIAQRIKNSHSSTP